MRARVAVALTFLGNSLLRFYKKPTHRRSAALQDY